jgi:hypothetical protein
MSRFAQAPDFPAFARDRRARFAVAGALQSQGISPPLERWKTRVKVRLVIA